MSLRLTRRERKQAKAYRAMVRRVRRRCKAPKCEIACNVVPLRGVFRVED
jgi:hypothetical protein